MYITPFHKTLNVVVHQTITNVVGALAVRRMVIGSTVSWPSLLSETQRFQHVNYGNVDFSRT